MGNAVKIQRRVLTPVHCHICGGWLCDVELQNGRVVLRCSKCREKVVVTVKNRLLSLFLERRKTAA